MSQSAVGRTIKKAVSSPLRTATFVANPTAALSGAAAQEAGNAVAPGFGDVTQMAADPAGTTANKVADSIESASQVSLDSATPPPEVPTPENSAEEIAAKQTDARRAARRGRASTILSTGSGTTTSARRTLMGA